jgi:hypothetical protein
MPYGGSQDVNKPVVSLRDGRTLIYRQGSSKRSLSLDRLSNVDVSATADGEFASHHAQRTEYAGIDFEYQNKEGHTVGVELKFQSSPPSGSQIDKWLSMARSMAGNSPRSMELWVITPDAATLTIHRADNGREAKTFSLSRVVTAPDFANPAERSKDIDTAYVERRVKDWGANVRTLFHDVSEWASPNFITDMKTSVPMNEEMMRRFGVKEVKMPVLKISRKGTVAATLVPIGLWVIGANGRVDLLTPKQAFIVVNTAAHPRPPEWSVYGKGTGAMAFDKKFMTDKLNADEAT